MLSTVVLVKKDGTVIFRERDIWVVDKNDQESKPILSEDWNKDRAYTFKLSDPVTH